MKNKIIRSMVLCSAALVMSTSAIAQATFSAGPELKNDPDNKMNRMLGGDDNSFYCYRVRSKGKGTSFYIEKYNKGSLKPEFSKEVSLGEDEKGTTIEDVEYAEGNIFVFRRTYDKKNDKMTLFFQTISSSGVVSPELKEVCVIPSDHYEFVDFSIYPNPSATKILVKAAHKASKQDVFKTDFIIIDAKTIKKQESKRIEQNLHPGNSAFASFLFSQIGFSFGGVKYGFIDLYFNDKDDIFYCMFEKNSGEKEVKGRLNLYSLKASDSKPKMLNLPFDDTYGVNDIEFSLAADGDVVVGGFATDIEERKGRDLVKSGIFSFKVNPTSNSIVGKTIYFFEDKMLTALESTPKKARYNNYKLDYIMPVGDAVYYVGEQYRLTEVTTRSSTGMTSTTYNYEYMDVIVAKLTSKGTFEWITNVPLRNEMSMNFPHVFKQYIAYATDKNLYILCDDHPKNMERYEKPDFEPKDLKSVKGIHGSNFVSNAVDLKTGKIKRQMIFENDEYCFAPIQERNPSFIPPSDCEIFVPSKNKEIYIYTEDRGKDRFGKIKFE